MRNRRDRKIRSSSLTFPFLVATALLSAACGGSSGLEPGEVPPFTPAPSTPTALADDVNVLMYASTCVTLTGTDPEGDPLSYLVVAEPGTGTLQGDGAHLVYTSPGQGLDRFEHIRFVVLDGNGRSEPAVVRMEVIVPILPGDEIYRASVSSTGSEANGPSEVTRAGPALSRDGRLVVFSSRASNLVSSDTNGAGDIFLHDREAGDTIRVSQYADGGQCLGHSENPALSPCGRYIAYISSKPPPSTVPTCWIYDCISGESKVLSSQIRLSYDVPSFSDAATYIALSGTIQDPEDTNGWQDVYVFERLTGTFTRVSVLSDGSQAVGGASSDPVISADGRFVAFFSVALNLAPGDTDGGANVFLHDRDTDENGVYDEPGGISTRQINLAFDGSQPVGGFDGVRGPLVMSANGRYVAFASDSVNLVPGDTNRVTDVFVRDTLLDETVCVKIQADGSDFGGTSGYPTISRDGRFVGFALGSEASGRGGQVWVHDRDADENGIFDETGVGCRSTVRVDRNADGDPGDGRSSGLAISGNAHYIALYSESTNLVQADGNGVGDVFIAPVPRGP